MKVLIVDPPSGWRYGFPRIFDFKASDPKDYEVELKQWFWEKGYSQELIDQGMLKYCRYWETDI